MIVLEGIDNTGKSTLAREIAHTLHWSVQGSEGPPKEDGEMDRRVARYLSRPSRRMIYDRHPCVSNPIYDLMRKRKTGPNANLITEFYRRRPVLIYCHPQSGRGLEGHVIKPERDTAEHLAAIHDGYKLMLAAYVDWAIERAHIFYRIGDDICAVIEMARAYSYLMEARTCR